MGEDPRGLVHWVPRMRWSACGLRVEPSNRDFPTCLPCMAAWAEDRGRRRDRREHAYDVLDELFR